MKKLISQKQYILLILSSIAPSTLLTMSSPRSTQATQKAQEQQQVAHTTQQEIPQKQQAQQPEKLDTAQDQNQTPKKPESVGDYIKAGIRQTTQSLKQLQLSSACRTIALLVIGAFILKSTRTESMPHKKNKNLYQCKVCGVGSIGVGIPPCPICNN